MNRFAPRLVSIASIAATLLLTSALVTARQKAAPYTAQRDGDAVRLRDQANDINLAVLPGSGNLAVEMTVKGVPVLHYPSVPPDEARKRPQFAGIPFMAPWANRLDEPGFRFGGRHYLFNKELGNVRGEHPIHGLVTFAPWDVVEAKADGSSSWLTSRLDFYRQPAWMAQFPFAHTIEVTYRLSDGVLEVATRVMNLSAETMPLSLGFHPYLKVADAPRDDWTLSLAARSEWLLSADKLPTGGTRPLAERFPDPRRIPLRGLDLDDVYGDLARDANGNAMMTVRGRAQRLDVTLGPNYRAVVVYAPAREPSYVCIEPMTGITNAFNLADRGVYKDLQTIPAGGRWEERFSIRPSGF